MRPLTLTAAALVASLVLASGTARSAEVTVTYRFEDPVVEAAAEGFVRVEFPRTVQAGVRGGPSFPFRGAAILLPVGHSVSTVRIIRRGRRDIPGRVELHPRQDPVPGTGSLPGERTFLLDTDLYSKDSLIQPPDSEFRTHYLSGHPLAVGSFSPVCFNPARKEAFYFSEVEVSVTTAPDGRASGALRLLRDDPATLDRLAAIVDNPGSVPCPGAASAGLAEGDAARLLIIADSASAGLWSSLKEFYDVRGVPARIATVEGILSAYSGLDPADELRMHITDEYVSSGVTHVLLAGDSDGGEDAVPGRGLYCSVQSSSLYEDAAIPADIYFASLDGNWNTDGDSLWGEPGEDDLYAEVAVGRVPADSPGEISAFIEKTTMYQESPHIGSAERALMLGEHLYSDPLTWGGDELDQLLGTCTAHGFTTTGMPGSFDITKYYDRDIGSWSSADLYAGVNAGTNWVFHNGHSNQFYVMRTYISSVDTMNFTNDGAGAAFPVVYSLGCIAGGFDYDDCIGEATVTGPTFASAFVGNSRYGWFHEGTTNGPSHHLQREFVDAVFTEGHTTLGGALQRARDETVPFIDLPDEYEPGAHRWSFYTLNLLGDPAMDAWTGEPTPLSVYHSSRIGRSDTAFALETDDPGSTAALSWNGSCLGRGGAETGGNITIALDGPIPAEADSLTLTATAHDRLVYTARVGIAETSGDAAVPPRIALFQNLPNPFNPVTVIRFSLSRRGPVDLRVYDVAGREVALLASRTMEEGTHEIPWNPPGLSSGVYFYVLRAEGVTLGRKAILLR